MNQNKINKEEFQKTLNALNAEKDKLTQKIKDVNFEYYKCILSNINYRWAYFNGNNIVLISGYVDSIFLNSPNQFIFNDNCIHVISNYKEFLVDSESEISSRLWIHILDLSKKEILQKYNLSFEKIYSLLLERYSKSHIIETFKQNGIQL